MKKLYSRNIIISLLFIGAFLVSDLAMSQGRYKRRYKRGKVSNSYHRKHVSTGGAFRKYQYVGFNVNAMNYYGDLAPVNRVASTDVSFTRPGFGVLWGYRYHQQAGLRAMLNWGLLKGDDITAERDEENLARYYRNLSFRNNITELVVGFDFHLLRDNNSPSGRHPFNAYLFIGGAVFHHNPQGKVPEYDYQVGDETNKLKDAGKWVSLRNLGTEGQNLEGGKPYSSIEFAIPVAVGAHIKIPETPIDIHLELGYRFLFTDYIDDVSSKYVNLDRFDDPLARIMSDRSAEPVGVWQGEKRQDFTTTPLDFNGETYNVNGWIRSNVDGESIRGNPKDNDQYFVTTIRVTYILQPRSSRSAKYR